MFEIPLEIKSSSIPIDEHVRRPDWLKVKIPGGKIFSEVMDIVHSNKLNTVCEDAHCPNIAECWGRGTATFMILGDICTRSCGFCAVKTGRPGILDWDEPRRVVEAIKKMKIHHAVITSVNRDELENGGAEIFASVIRGIHQEIPGCRVEVLIPDFQGYRPALKIVLDAQPEILAHNVETVPRLYKTVRPQAKYDRSLQVLDYSKKQEATTKAGMMLGIGETQNEVLYVMKDLRDVNCDILTLGQYLQPSKEHLPVDRFVHPDEFAYYKKMGLEWGFKHVESGPLVRSSYHADSQE
jgi:lipoic acid synthetase